MRSCPSWGHSSWAQTPQSWFVSFPKVTESRAQATPAALSSLPPSWPQGLFEISTTPRWANPAPNQSAGMLCLKKEKISIWLSLWKLHKTDPTNPAWSSAWHWILNTRGKETEENLKELTQLIKPLQPSLPLSYLLLCTIRGFSPQFLWAVGATGTAPGILMGLVIFHPDTKLQLLRGAREVWGDPWGAFTFHFYLCFTLFVFLLLLLERCSSKQQW